MARRKPKKKDPFDDDDYITRLLAVRDVLSPRPGQPQVEVSLEDIERAAHELNCEVLFGPQKVKLVRVLYHYLPCPQAGPGMWRCCDGDELLAAALSANALEGITPSMLRALQLADFVEHDSPLKSRFEKLESEAYET
jgi:hypothetical protein